METTNCDGATRNFPALRMWTLQVAAMLVAAASVGCAPEDVDRPAPDAEEVLSLLDAYDQAITRKDGEWMRSLLSDEYVYFQSTGGMRDKESVLGMVTSPDYHLESRSREEVTVRFTGSTAVVETRWRGVGTYEGERFVDDQRCGLVFVPVEGTWRLASEHCVQIQ